MRERIRRLSARSEFFLVISLSFAYFIGTSLWVLLLRIRVLDLTTGRALRGVATEMAILVVVGWILRVRGWDLRRLMGRFTWPAVFGGIGLFVAFYVLYVLVTLAVLAVYPPAAQLSTVRFIVSAPVAVIFLFILVNSVFEELLVTGYVVAALSEQGPALAVTASALLRFLYHLYQGPVASMAVLPLGLLFGAAFWKWRTLWPLVIAHTLANILASIVAR
jgi:uncharacterized protein